MKTREVRNAIPPEPPLRVLIFGAGVLGSLYGARLAEAGNDVAVLARGRRLEELRARGVVLEDVRSGARTATPVRIVSELAPDDRTTSSSFSSGKRSSRPCRRRSPPAVQLRTCW